MCLLRVGLDGFFRTKYTGCYGANLLECLVQPGTTVDKLIRHSHTFFFFHRSLTVRALFVSNTVKTMENGFTGKDNLNG